MSTSQIVSISIQASYELNGESAEEVRKGLKNDIRTALTSGILSARLPGPMLQGFEVKSNVQPARPEIALGTLATVFFEAFAVSDRTNGPIYASVDVTADYLESLLRTRDQMEAGVDKVVQYVAPYWGPGDIESDMRLTEPGMVVTKTEFWFEDKGKYAGKITTRAVNIDEFVRAVNDGQRFFGNDPAELEIVVQQLTCDEEEAPAPGS